MKVRKTRQVARAAFTLMEMLIVVAIIVVLAGLSATFLLPALERAKEDAAKTKAVSIASNVERYYLNHGEFPSDLSVLTQPDAELNNAPYMQPDGIIDPWNQRYQLDASGGAAEGVHATREQDHLEFRQSIGFGGLVFCRRLKRKRRLATAHFARSSAARSASKESLACAAGCGRGEELLRVEIDRATESSWCITSVAALPCWK